jgi:dihydropteroate synthase-like protein
MGKKVLLVTGKLAEPLVRKHIANTGVEFEIKSLPIPVATFISSRLLVESLRGLNPLEYSMLLVPGLARCNLKEVEEALGIPAFRGPRHVADLPFVLKNLGRVELSKERPADELIESKITSAAREILRRAEENVEELLLRRHNFLVGKGIASVAAGKDFPPRVIAEVADAPLLSRKQFTKVAEHYLKSGAEIIDIGMVADETMPERVSELVSAIRERFEVPVSVDTLNSREIEAAVDAGADMIISLCGDSIEEFAGLKIPAVLIPIHPKRNYYPCSPDEKIKYLLSLVERAKELGYARVIADPILDPLNLGFVESLASFYEFRKHEPDLPLMMGIGNVVELCDADSAGMVALLTGAASELNASFLLAVEASDKTRGCLAEVRRARDMMTVARVRGTAPKDLGLDLLRLKEKRRVWDEYDEGIEGKAEVIRAGAPGEFKPDPRGSFRLFVHGDEIIAVLYRKGEPEVVVKGKTAKEVSHEITRRGLVTTVEHAVYLGRELQKAETALRTGRGYVQDRNVF